MTPHLDRGEGTFLLDIRLGKLGRYKRASGTTDHEVLANLKAMLRMLRKARRWDVLALLVNGVVTPLDLHDAFVQGELDRLPSAEDLLPLKATVTRWIETLDRKPSTVRQYEWLLSHFGDDRTTLAQVPPLLEAERTAALRSGKRTRFNNLSTAVRRMLGWAVKPKHPIYEKVAEVESLRVTDRRKGNPQSPEELTALATALGPLGLMAWAVALTGMRRDEYFRRRFAVLADRITVHGTKSKAADRVVFKAYPITQPTCSYDHFRDVLSDVSDSQVRVHDLRYTFDRWCGDAGINYLRVRWYMGHAVKDVGELYRRGRGFTEYLHKDAERMRLFLGDGPARALAVAP